MIGWVKNLKLRPTATFLFLGSLVAVLHLPGITKAGNDTDRIRSAVVKIKNISQRTSYDSPWEENDFSGGRGSGVVISGNRILTSAHVVSDSKYIEVEKENSGTPYRAVVAYIAHDCDLALIEVLDQSFFNETAYLSFNEEIPELGSVVFAYGFPSGGRRISVTRGVVSRIDYALYSHSARDFHLILQIDAAINPGNSGGPVLQDGKIVGIAFQAIQPSENIGHVIPITVINHFLDDIEDGCYDGYPDLGIISSNLLNPAYQEYVNLPSDKTGVVVADLIDGHSGVGILRRGDIILSIDGNPIRNDGTILINGESYQLEEVVERKQVGDEVIFNIIRDGEEINCLVPLKKNNELLKTWNEYEKTPEYFLYGGLLFQPLSREYLKTWRSDWWNRADPRLLYYYNYYNQDKLCRDLPEVILLSRVLPAKVNQYYTDLADLVVKRVNGIKIKSLADLVGAFENQTGAYHVIEFDGDSPPCVLSVAEVAEENQAIMERYRVRRDRNLSSREIEK